MAFFFAHFGGGGTSFSLTFFSPCFYQQLAQQFLFFLLSSGRTQNGTNPNYFCSFLPRDETKETLNLLSSPRVVRLQAKIFDSFAVFGTSLRTPKKKQHCGSSVPNFTNLFRELLKLD
jgi:hypothetical protein